MEIEKVWVNGEAKADGDYVYQQRLVFSWSPNEEPRLHKKYGLIIGINPPDFPLNEFTSTQSWKLCGTKRTHQSLAQNLDKMRKIVLKKNHILPFSKVLCITNIHQLCGPLDKSMEILKHLPPNQIKANLLKHLPDGKPGWIWCAWSDRVSPIIRATVISVLKEKYRGSFNFALYGQDPKIELHINQAEQATHSKRVWRCYKRIRLKKL